MKNLFYLIYLVPWSVFAADVHIDIVGINSTDGQVVLRVWDSDESYLKQPLLIKMIPAKNANNAVLRFTVSHSLPSECAINVFHDKNSNGQLDTNWLGIPNEPTGMSNNAKGRLGPPSYQEAKISLSGQEQVFTIKIKEI
ncbi:DUF2141 domain-containing protein [Agarivorans sp. MS3-6]